MRLDKFIGHSSDLSRSQIHIAIRRGEVLVNGVVAKLPREHIDQQDQVTLQGRLLAAPGKRYLMLHKPSDVLCARTDANQPCVLDLIDSDHKSGLQIVGRLDKDTTGLLLLTDDGQWNHRITSPRHRCSKVYRVTTAEPISEGAVEQLAAGMHLRGDKHPCLPAHLQILDSHTALLDIQEGRYHQVKRLFGALGNRVVTLHRQSIGAIELDPALAPGQWRHLTADEIASV
ncbi:pseudouridine synthase [Marinimicrobium sp. ABcell2]|uniref:pseudouridine synthase n=1 Tax=Marinimicrobium sp. ABcell2 TaxID=3069751 RepID=UPI0027B138B8|nr:pseudouridine synthase [Marinimicrobium sp. ABcell2]MDQ2075510.1 pseudouridine synthase [Marinimicrobium sp. ABcell2]